jgi:hypothetical protein
MKLVHKAGDAQFDKENDNIKCMIAHFRILTLIAGLHHSSLCHHKWAHNLPLQKPKLIASLEKTLLGQLVTKLTISTNCIDP